MKSNPSQKIQSNSLLEFLKKLCSLHQLRIWKFRRIDQLCKEAARGDDSILPLVISLDATPTAASFAASGSKHVQLSKRIRGHFHRLSKRTPTDSNVTAAPAYSRGGR